VSLLTLSEKSQIALRLGGMFQQSQLAGEPFQLGAGGGVIVLGLNLRQHIELGPQPFAPFDLRAASLMNLTLNGWRFIFRKLTTRSRQSRRKNAA